jgi:SAM-dependent methyltransferase
MKFGPRNTALLEEGARGHYREPLYYSKAYKSRTGDIAFYRELAARSGGPVLEYGCGNGRITVPMAEQGVKVVGLDHAAEMLTSFRARLRKLPPQLAASIELVRGDMRKVRLQKRFKLVLCTFNTFLHLYDRADVERFLACVRAHLRRDGRFVFDVSMPSASELARDPTRGFRVPPMRYPATGELVRYAEFFDYDAARQILYVTMQFEPVDAPERAWTTLLTHRQYHPKEIEALLHYNGFAVESVTSDFEDRPLDRHTDSAIWTARARVTGRQRASDSG